MLRKSAEGGVAHETQNRKFKSLDDPNVLLNVEPASVPYFGQVCITLSLIYHLALTSVHLKDPALMVLLICRHFFYRNPKCKIRGILQTNARCSCLLLSKMKTQESSLLVALTLSNFICFPHREVFTPLAVCK